MPAPKPPALSAPGLIGPISILNQPIAGPSSKRRSKNRPYAHVHLEIDLASDRPASSKVPVLRRLEELLSRRPVSERQSLVRLVGGALHALSAHRFRRIDHWEVVPGGWLPLPAGPGAHHDEPVGYLLNALEGDSARALARSRSFAARLSDLRGDRVDLTVRRLHRLRRHAISLDLWGLWTHEEVRALTGTLSERLPISTVTVTRYRFA